MLDGLTTGLLDRSEAWPDVTYLLFAIVCVLVLVLGWAVRYHIRAMRDCERRRRESEAARIADAAAERERWAAAMEKESDRKEELTAILTQATSTLSRLEHAMNWLRSGPSGRNGV